MRGLMPWCPSADVARERAPSCRGCLPREARCRGTRSFVAHKARRFSLDLVTLLSKSVLLFGVARSAVGRWKGVWFGVRGCKLVFKDLGRYALYPCRQRTGGENMASSEDKLMYLYSPMPRAPS